MIWVLHVQTVWSRRLELSKLKWGNKTKRGEGVCLLGFEDFGLETEKENLLIDFILNCYKFVLGLNSWFLLRWSGMLRWGDKGYDRE